MLTKREIFSYGAIMCPKERLLSKYEVAKNGCWEYTGGKDQYGYGRFKIAGRQLGAHKVSYVLHNSDVPKGLVVMHTCDNPGCINPNHLRLGTVKDNVHDCIQKGRFPFNSFKRRSSAKRRIIIGHSDKEMLVFTDVYALKKAGFHDGSVSYAISGKYKTYRGYKWQYEDRKLKA